MLLYWKLRKVIHKCNRILSSQHFQKRKHSFVTLPIFYVNAGTKIKYLLLSFLFGLTYRACFAVIAPHIGHLYTSLLGDALVKWQRMVDPKAEVLFSSGVDEHGTKVLCFTYKPKCTE